MTTPHEQLADDLNRRRQDLRIKWTGVAQQLGISPQHLLRIRQGTATVSADVAVAVDDFMAWPRGTASQRFLTTPGDATWDAAANALGLTLGLDRTAPDLASSADKLTPEDIEKIRAMTFDEIIAHANEARKTSEKAALLFLKVAGEIKTKTPHPTPSDL